MCTRRPPGPQPTLYERPSARPESTKRPSWSLTADLSSSTRVYFRDAGAGPGSTRGVLNVVRVCAGANCQCMLVGFERGRTGSGRVTSAESKEGLLGVTTGVGVGWWKKEACMTATRLGSSPSCFGHGVGPSTGAVRIARTGARTACFNSDPLEERLERDGLRPGADESSSLSSSSSSVSMRDARGGPSSRSCSPESDLAREGSELSEALPSESELESRPKRAILHGGRSEEPFNFLFVPR